MKIEKAGNYARAEWRSNVSKLVQAWPEFTSRFLPDNPNFVAVRWHHLKHENPHELTNLWADFADTEDDIERVAVMSVIRESVQERLRGGARQAVAYVLSDDRLMVGELPPDQPFFQLDDRFAPRYRVGMRIRDDLLKAAMGVIHEGRFIPCNDAQTGEAVVAVSEVDVPYV